VKSLLPARITSRLPRRTVRRLITTLAIVPLFATVAGCSSGSSGASPSAAASGAAVSQASASGGSGTATFPVTVTADNGQVTLPARPRSIVSLSPTLTEMLFAIGAGPQVKAVDDQSTYPSQAPRTKLSGFQPNVEAIAGYSPDLVVLSGNPSDLVSALTKLKLPVLLFDAPETIADAYAQELALGKATGHEPEAGKAVDDTRRRIAAAVASVGKDGVRRKVYHEVDQTFYSVTSATFIGDLYRQFGLVNIADSAPKVAGGYPQLSAEFVVNAAPDLIVLADGKCCGQSAATVAKRKAFASVPAVMGGKVLVVDDDVASRWGPRLGDFAEQIAKTLGGAG
jgi:iron complex transport system substrate-binding protein